MCPVCSQLKQAPFTLKSALRLSEYVSFSFPSFMVLFRAAREGAGRAEGEEEVGLFAGVWVVREVRFFSASSS